MNGWKILRNDIISLASLMTCISGNVERSKWDLLNWPG